MKVKADKIKARKRMGKSGANAKSHSTRPAPAPTARSAAKSASRRPATVRGMERPVPQNAKTRNTRAATKANVPAYGAPSTRNSNQNLWLIIGGAGGFVLFLMIIVIVAVSSSNKPSTPAYSVNPASGSSASRGSTGTRRNFGASAAGGIKELGGKSMADVMRENGGETDYAKQRQTRRKIKKN